MKHLIDVTFAGLTFPCALRYPETARYFPAPDPAASRVEGESVCLTEKDWQFYLDTDMEDCAHTEFSLLTAAFSDALMDHDRMILHSVALRWRDKAYLIAARSGAGKSTQARCLQELRPGEFGIICGDRPILEFRHSERSEESVPIPVAAHSVRHAAIACHSERSEESASPSCSAGNLPARSPVPKPSPLGKVSPQATDEVIVHPSPWNGKENWYGAEAAPLAGLILLERGDENRLAALSPREAAIRTYAQLIQLCSDSAKIKKAAELTTRLLNSVPIWQLTTFQVPDSTKLLLESVF